MLKRHGFAGDTFLVFHDDTKQVAILMSRVLIHAPALEDMAKIITRHVH